VENCSSSSKIPIPISHPFTFTIAAEEIAIGNTFGTKFSKFRATPGNTFESPLDLLLSKHSARELNAGTHVTRRKSELGLSRKPAAQEKEIIEAALRESGGRVSGQSGAAAKLGIPGSTLESKIRSLKIKKNRFKTTDPSTDRI